MKNANMQVEEVIAINGVCEAPIHHRKHDSHAKSVISSLLELEDYKRGVKRVILDGNSLDLAAVTAVARYGVLPTLTRKNEILATVVRSVNVLHESLAQGKSIYGVTTGFGGSADTRTEDYEALQKALIQHHNAAVLLPSDRGLSSPVPADGMKSHAIPIPIVKASMLCRSNSLIRGHSAVRLQVIESLNDLLAKDLTPVVPLRGSISASGDLTPLAYVAGVLEGNSDIYVNCGRSQNFQILPADRALKRAGLMPLTLGPKEGLGLLNGTTFSCGAASMVLFDANQLALLSQILTAMGTEALLGSVRNYHPFIARVRPHPGQQEAAENVSNFLKDSRMAADTGPDSSGLAQDRYALRTSSQWIGPSLEDLMLAQRQVECELNSTTDNPLFDPVHKEVHHGGNFQAASVTSAMEKTMRAVQMIGKMVFAQCSEIINPMLNKGLPPNLCADDPSLSFAFKGVDINMASYMSELAYLAHPVSSYVQSAEMHNQALNSLALISSRYTADAVEVLSLMVATYLYVLCQALDLRALHLEFATQARPDVYSITDDICKLAIPDAHVRASVQESIWTELMGHWARNSTSDLSARAEITANHSVGMLLELLSKHHDAAPIVNGNGAGADGSDGSSTASIQDWKNQVSNMLQHRYSEAREAFFKHQSTETYICSASRQLYCFVRETLAVPMHKGIVDHPTYASGEDPTVKKTIGSHISTIYYALCKGEFMAQLMACWSAKS
ncbi:phenylalanine ammonia-lyase [Polytolypa hystricis UAMH7299]|uniref:Phenylalanine ammonia-lyase n=1 Tax=Polytolypa hystricis (strain UAMH7299) TaxID=1447883 RepID=A0A2B7Z471_POLH7|nr:phenylalanine ammonia-lyase [Polytolypa hystricis UAMH7299]